MRLLDNSLLKGRVSVDHWEVTTATGKFDIRSTDITAIVPRDSRVIEPGRLPDSKPEQPETPQLGMKPQKVLSLDGGIGSMLFSPDGKKLYLLESLIVLVVDTGTFDPPKEIPLHGEESFLSISMDGKTLVAAGKKTITIVDAAAQQMTRSFQIEKEVTALWAGDGETLYVGTNGGLLQVSAQKQGVASTICQGGARLWPRPDGKKLYSGDCYILLQDIKTPSFYGRLMVDQGVSRGSQAMSIAPDGRYAVSDAGTVLRLGNSPLADMIAFARIEPNHTCVFLQKRERALVFTQDGFIKSYVIGSFDLEKSYPLGLMVGYAFADESADVLYAFGVVAQPNLGGFAPTRRGSTCGLYRFELPK